MDTDRSIIRLGIDLGTTNSEIAINNGTEIEIINNSRGDLYTPSVFGINKRGNEVVGKDAYIQLFNKSTKDEASNYKAEVKRLMGTNEKIHFARNKRDYSPEEISSEILKTLKSDALIRYPELSTKGVVITVPAFFDTVQSEATKRAGKLAGFEHIVLLQEPIAAAIAYGFSNRKNENWLVYDLGGGTFDVALISSNDGMLRVVEHGGDNYLGGKDVDELIVENVIKPKILEAYAFSDFSKTNPEYFAAFCRLKAIAEEAKIKLSSATEVDMEIMDLGLFDEDGKEVDLFFPYKRKDLEKLITPIIDKTIVIAKNVIGLSKMKTEAISKIIFVGAPTQTPFIKFKVERELGISVDTSVNPFTVVAKGAAYYGLSQRIPDNLLDHQAHGEAGEIKMTLHYDPMTSEDEQLITGSFDIKSETSYFVKISSDSGSYNSEKIKVVKNSFVANVRLERNKTSLFWVYLIDDKGNHLKINPNSFSITQGMSVMGAPIPHAIGVVYSIQTADVDMAWEDTCDPFFERSSVPPLRETKTYKTVKLLKKGTEMILPIIVYEGDNKDPNLNQEVTRIGIDGRKLPFNLDKGEEVEITISITESRELDVEVYIPVADLSLNARIDMYSKAINTDALKNELEVLKNDFEMLDESLTNEEKNLLEQMIQEIETIITNSDDADSQQKAQRDIKEVKNKMNQLKESTAFSRLQKQFEESLNKTKKEIEAIKDTSEQEDLNDALGQVEKVATKSIDDKDEKSLAQTIEQLDAIQHRAQAANPSFWIGLLVYLETIRSSLSNQFKANQLFAKAHESIEQNDFEGLKSNVVELIQLVSRANIDSIPVNLAGITK